MTENLAHPQFSKGLSGYKVEEVDSYIDKVLDTIKDLKDQNEVLEEKIGVLAESLQKYREDEDSLREALLARRRWVTASSRTRTIRRRSPCGRPR